MCPSPGVVHPGKMNGRTKVERSEFTWPYLWDLRATSWMISKRRYQVTEANQKCAISLLILSYHDGSITKVSLENSSFSLGYSDRWQSHSSQPQEDITEIDLVGDVVWSNFSFKIQKCGHKEICPESHSQ